MKNSNLRHFKPNPSFTTKLTSLLVMGNYLLIGLILIQNVFAQAPQLPKHYVCYRAASPLKIDGKLDEKSWKKVAWTDLFVDIEGDKKPLPLQKTRAKMLWDDTHLYIGTEIEEDHIWAYQNKKDQIVFHENDFEVFIDPDGDQENYYELEINAINNSFDLFLPKTYKNGGIAKLDWNITGLKSAVSINGTLNDASDKDKKWFLEIAIPLASLHHDQISAITPANQSIWRINFSRVNWQHEVFDGKYHRRKDPETKRTIPEYNWVWSPQGTINMHQPQHWGYLLFSSKKAGAKKIDFKLPEVEKMKAVVWNAYVAQRDFRSKNKQYTTLLTDLNVNAGSSDNIIAMESDGKSFLILILNRSEKKKISIDHNGRLLVEELKGNEKSDLKNNPSR